MIGMIILNKKQLRKKMIKILQSFSKEEKLEKEQKIHQKLLNFIEENGINSVGLVLSMPHEIDTWPIIERLKENGVKLYAPKSDYVTKGMNFYEVKEREDLLTDDKGILIPDDTNELNNSPELLIVPGVIFNEKGYRTGYCGGFYDRFLKDFNGLKISALFDEQFGEVIVESHDMPVDLLITPTKTINAKENRLND